MHGMIIGVRRMPSKLILACQIDGENHRMEMSRCDNKHVHVCNKNGRLCNFPQDVPDHCKFVGKQAENCVIERVTT